MTNSEPNTDDLVRLAVAGDASAMGLLLERHRDRLAKMVEVRMDPRLHGRFDPSDVVQESLAAASQRISRYADERPLPFYPWLRQIAWEKLVHLHDRHLRAAKRSVAREQIARPEISDESVVQLAERFVGSATSPSGFLARKELRERVRLALNTLGDDDREVLLLRYLEQLPSCEIAMIMGTTEAAVNMRHMRALERMRKRLHTPGEEI
jgi:RNA polymerase sigma-70 factor (ECF subfamily)